MLEIIVLFQMDEFPFLIKPFCAKEAFSALLENNVLLPVIRESMDDGMWQRARVAAPQPIAAGPNVCANLE